MLTCCRLLDSCAPSVMGVFTPWHGALGGLLIGVSTVAQLLLLGRVLGLSGAVKGVIQRQPGEWRYVLLGSMLAASVPLGLLLPNCFTALPETYTFSRAVLGGLLVGLGTALGNGCTSGHAICGVARLSPRSLVYTALFMAAGMVAATLTGAAAAAGVATHAALPLALPSRGAITLSLGTTAVACLAFIAVWLNGSRKEPSLRASLEAVATAVIGASFAVGLALSGMTLPGKVLGFLSPTIPAWDASLAFVMATALAIALLGYQSVLGKLPLLPEGLRSIAPAGSSAGPGKPLLLPSYSLPTGSVIDTKLILGGVLFGTGWGMTGMCPGPAIVAFMGSMAMKVLLAVRSALDGSTATMGPCLCSRTGAYVLAMVLGMWLEGRLSKALTEGGVKAKEK